MNLADVAELFQGCDAFPHNWNFLRTIINRTNANGAGITGVDRALVVLNRDKLALVVKYRPILLEELRDGGADRRIEVR